MGIFCSVIPVEVYAREVEEFRILPNMEYYFRLDILD